MIDASDLAMDLKQKPPDHGGLNFAVSHIFKYKNSNV
jgi:hypothetical protein